ncbi:MAG: T9SS type A sorting domain-containing protein [Chitinophagales bacterium]
MQNLMRHFLKPLLAVFIFFTCVQAYTQTPEFAPIGAKWWYAELYYDSWADTTPDQGFLLIESIGDTIIEGVNCRILQSTRTTFENEVYPSLNQFIYQDSLKIYTWIDTAFYLIYDFSGDDFKIPNPDPWDENDTTLIVIDSIDFIEISGIDFKRFYTHDDPIGFGYINNSIIEFLGSVSYLFPITYNSTFLFIRSNGLSCYEDSVLSYKAVNYACDTTFIVPTYILENRKEFIYNYFDNYLVVNSDNSFDLALYSINGQQVFELNNVLYVAEYLGTLPKGIYMIKIYLKDNIHLIKITVI